MDYTIKPPVFPEHAQDKVGHFYLQPISEVLYLRRRGRVDYPSTTPLAGSLNKFRLEARPQSSFSLGCSSTKPRSPAGFGVFTRLRNFIHAKVLRKETRHD